MNYYVSTKDLGSITLNESDVVKSVLQNIRIILLTRQFSVPLYRGFGLPMQFVDKPAAVARSLLIAEIKDAIAEYEPRATVLNVTLDTDITAPGKLVATVEVRIDNEE
ncbi:MAG: GPW/gp25 family protein [Sphaerochaetaceae bacterium]|nr:GPW/gp25 family protein [Sphaerochaetaceae bacterium]